MKYADIKIKSDAELAELLGLERAKLHQLLASAAERQLKNVRQIRVTKTTIAQILTEQAQRQSSPSTVARGRVDTGQAQRLAKAA